MSALNATVRARVEQELRDAVLEECERQDRSESALVRRYVREGVERDRNRRDHSRRA